MPLDLEEPGGDGISPCACAFPSPAAGGCPGKTSGKRMARGIQETGAGGLTRFPPFVWYQFFLMSNSMNAEI
jgi:hypothetical protein